MKRILSKLGIFAKIKSLKLPIKIGGIALILAVGLVIWQPSIVKGEFDIQAIFDRLTQHDQKIADLEKKTEDTKAEVDQTKTQVSEQTAVNNNQETKIVYIQGQTEKNTSDITRIDNQSTPTPDTLPDPDPYIADWLGVFGGYIDGQSCGSSRQPCALGTTFSYIENYVNKVAVNDQLQPVHIIKCDGSYATNGNTDGNPPYFQYPVTGVVAGYSSCIYSFTPQYDGSYSIHGSATTTANTPEKTKVQINQARACFKPGGLSSC